jgi:hypothetical protein
MVRRNNDSSGHAPRSLDGVAGRWSFPVVASQRHNTHPSAMDYDCRRPGINRRGAAIVVMLALASISGAGMGQDPASRVSANATQDDTQIELLAMRVIHSELTRRGVTDWNTVGFDPDWDAGLKPLHPKRGGQQARNMLAMLGGRRFSRDSVAPTSLHCHLNGLTTLVYMGPPHMSGDSATVSVSYNIKDQRTACRFFVESKTLSFERHDGTWMYTGIKELVYS